MPKPPPTKEEFLAKCMAKGEKAWEKRARHPKAMGRPSHREADRKAISEIVAANAGFSGPKFALWTLAEWIKKVGESKGEPAPGRATIIKHLKEIFSRNRIPIHLIPAKMVQAMPREARLEHFYVLALAEAFITTTRPGSKSLSASFPMVDAIHRRLCDAHLWKKKRFPEAQRREWLVAKWNKTKCVPIQSRKPAATPTPTAPRNPKAC